MQSAQHLGIVELLTRDLAIIPELIARAQGCEPPTGLRYERRDGRLIAYSFKDPPREIAVDLLLVAFPADVPGGAPQFVRPIEFQLSRDWRKRFRFLDYVAAARRDLGCPGQTVVFSPDDEVLEECRRMFADEPHFCPVLVGKDAVPRVLTLDEAVARHELATLSAIVHEQTDTNLEIAQNVLASWRHVERERWRQNVRVLHSCLSEESMKTLEQTDIYREIIEEEEGGEPGRWLRNTGAWQRATRKGLEEGKLQGLKQGLRLVLELRELVPTPEQQAVIDASTSLDELERWATRAKHAGSIAELLAA
jgi:hypothetical protein